MVACSSVALCCLEVRTFAPNACSVKAQLVWGRFYEVLRQRQAGKADELSTALASMSPGRAPSLWRELQQQEECAIADHETSALGSAPVVESMGCPRVLVVVGELDTKFVRVGTRLVDVLNGGSGGSEGKAKLVMIGSCGHAVHAERPLELLDAIAKFLQS